MRLNLQKVTFTGHSLGGALASLAALYFSDINKDKIDESFHKMDIQLYTYGQPRVGDIYYSEMHDEYVKNSWRIVH